VTAMRSEPLWTVEDVAGFLRIPVSTLYEWRRYRRGPKGRKVGKHLRYDPQEVRDWFNQQTV
jgi:predicted DNA-binding transcriptional regulator AlpA